MSNLLTAIVAIKGTRPLLWHHFGPDAIPLEKRKEKSGVTGHDPEEWRATALMTDNRQLYLQPMQVFGCLRDAARYTKKGRGSIMTVLGATLQVLSDRVLIDRFVPEEPIPTDATEPVYMDVRSVRNPTTRSRNVRYRIAAAPGWITTFEITWDKTIASRNEVEAVLRDAGTLVGIGDGRSIGLGRFEIVSITYAEEKTAAGTVAGDKKKSSRQRRP